VSVIWCSNSDPSQPEANSEVSESGFTIFNKGEKIFPNGVTGIVSWPHQFR